MGELQLMHNDGSAEWFVVANPGGIIATFYSQKDAEEYMETGGRILELEQHVADLQSGMYINCVYCGHRYGPRETTAATLPEAKTQTMADALTEHISTCPKHPLAKALLELADERERCAKIVYDMWNDAEVTEVIAAIRGETA
jgi:hypothetical protein